MVQPRMTNDELFQLYKKVQNKDKAAEDLLIREHKKLYPRSPLNKERRGESAYYRQALHTMYLHLTR